MTASDPLSTQFIALVERYCQLGRLLPAFDDVDTDDIAELSEIKTVLAEMTKTKAEIDQMLHGSVERRFS
jgi:hypothetical protein